MASRSGDAGTVVRKENETDIAKGSDQVLFCDICIEDKEEVAAICYCGECKDYLCETCKRGHVKNRMTRYHNILDADSMPKEKMDVQTNSSYFSQLESCKQHRKALTHICFTDNEMGCKLCVMAYHSQCDEVFPIKNVSNTEKDTDASKTMLKQIEDIQKRFQSCKYLSMINARKSSGMYSNALASLRDILMAIKSNDLIRMSTTSKACESILKDIPMLKEYLENSQKSDQPSHSYIAMKIAEKHVSNLEKTLETLDNDTTITVYEFLPKKVKQGSKADKACIGQLMVYSGAIPYFEINIESPTDKMKCEISNLHVLSTNLLFLVDRSNNKIKLVDTKKGKLTLELELLDCPVKAAKIDGTQFAVTQEGGRVQFMTVFLQTNTIVTDTSFKTDGECRGITYIPHVALLAVTIMEPGEIHVLDMAGNIMHKIDLDYILKPDMIVCPVHIIEMNEKLYVADTFEHNVMRMDLNGKVEAVFTYHDEYSLICSPDCIARGQGTDLLVAFSGLIHIVKVDQELQKGETILGGQDWFFEGSQMCFCQESKTLYVGTGEGKVRRYYISEEKLS